MTESASAAVTALQPQAAARERPRALNLPAIVEIPAEPAARNDIRTGGAILAGFCAIFILWGWLAPLATATLASGMLVVEGNRRTLQHLEGGIVREFLIRDGDQVKEGEVLIRLDDTQTLSTNLAVRGLVDGFRALDARLSAERTGDARIDFPADLLARRDDPAVAEIIAGQEAIFASRRASLEGQSSILMQRGEQLRAEISSYQAQMRAQEEQLRYIRGEIEDVRFLVDKGLERKPRLLALQRNAAQLVGVRDQQNGLISRAEQQIGETELQLLQLRNQRLAEITTEQRDLRADFLRAFGDEARGRFRGEPLPPRHFLTCKRLQAASLSASRERALSRAPDRSRQPRCRRRRLDAPAAALQRGPPTAVLCGMPPPAQSRAGR